MSKVWTLSELGDLSNIQGRLNEGQSLANLTWFRTGGPADIVFQPKDADDLSLFLKTIPAQVPVTVLGVGSNLLVRDGGIRGCVIRLSAKGFGGVENLGQNRLFAGAALTDRRLAAAALEAQIGGFAFYHGIPGALGGALRMNAGANGKETTSRVVEVYAIDRQGQKVTLSHEDMGFSYRHSDADEQLIFTGALLQGEPSETSIIRSEMDEVQHHRETVQPVKEKTGGSTFKNPTDNSAWKLVDEAGMRGAILGGAQISEMHCNFMINTGDASAFDIESLGEQVRSKVYENCGILLQWEIKRLGEYGETGIVDVFVPQK